MIIPLMLFLVWSGDRVVNILPFAAQFTPHFLPVGLLFERRGNLIEIKYGHAGAHIPRGSEGDVRGIRDNDA
jgi:hypothetical protein